jgi:CRP/FNR family transcriptional regulator
MAHSGILDACAFAELHRGAMNIHLERLHHLFPALAGLPSDLMVEVERQMQVVSVPSGTQLFDAGSPCQALPLVLEGSIRVSKRADSGREIGLYRVIPGEICIVSLSCLLGGDVYTAMGVAVEPLRLATLPRPLFMRLVERNAPFREMVFHLFSERLVSLMQLVEEVAFEHLDQRLAAWLVERGPHIDLSHQAIANELGSVREIVSRLLKQFEEHGWVRLERGHVEVLEPMALLGIADRTG